MKALNWRKWFLKDRIWIFDIYIHYNLKTKNGWEIKFNNSFKSRQGLSSTSTKSNFLFSWFPNDFTLTLHSLKLNKRPKIFIWKKLFLFQGELILGYPSSYKTTHHFGWLSKSKFGYRTRAPVDSWVQRIKGAMFV